MKHFKSFATLLVCVLAVAAIGAQAAGIDTSTITAFFTVNPDAGMGFSMLGMGSIEAVMKAMDGIESKLKSMSEKADGEMKTLGQVSADTKTALMPSAYSNANWRTDCWPSSKKAPHQQLKTKSMKAMVRSSSKIQSTHRSKRRPAVDLWALSSKTLSPTPSATPTASAAQASLKVLSASSPLKTC